MAENSWATRSVIWEGYRYISQKVFRKSFRKCRFPHESVNLSFIISGQVDGFVREWTSVQRLRQHCL
jgi:hypothetical protein